MDAISPPPLATSAPPPTGAQDLDIVIVDQGDLTFLDPWISILKSYNLIIISTGETKQQLHQDLRYESHAISELSRFLDPSKLPNNPEVSARSLAVLVSTRKYIAFVDLKSTAPATDPATGKPLDPFHQHLLNLRTPSTPFFFNTLYDPFRPGTDFVRGYPFSLRTGAPTALSHGSCLDANAPYADLVLTLPKGSFFPLSSLNVAFDRELVGPAMFLGAVEQRVCGDVWAGMCAKVVCDHLGVGIKLGLPYVERRDGEIAKGGENAEVVEEIVRFFKSIEIPEGAKSAAECYSEIVKKIGEGNVGGAICHGGLEAWNLAWKTK